MSGATVSADDLELVTLDGSPSLVRVLRAAAPLEASFRIPLADVARIDLGRGETATLSGRGTLVMAEPDVRMSSSHARFVRDGRRFSVVDAGSKNGTFVNGKRVETKELADGDVIEAGQTFFVYRARNPPGLSEHPASRAEDKNGELPLTTYVPALASQYQVVAKIAASTVPITVLGETGTGKEVVARAIHRMSGRRGPFVAINCGAIPPNLIESELFGAKRGAFSGAMEDRVGLLRSSDGGTLFLDEIVELPATAQIALLRVLQENEVTPLGATRPVKIDVRVVAATHRPLDRLVDAEAFRADLFARLGGLTVRLPPLRDRREDLALVIRCLLQRISPRPEQVVFSHAVGRALFAYPFPRNVRELEKVLGLAIAIASTERSCEIELEHLPEELHSITNPPTVTATPPSEDEEHKAHLIGLLVQHGGRISDVARAMGKARMQIHRWIQRYGLDIESYRK